MADGREDSLVNYTHAIYALQALSVLIGVASFRSILGSYLLGVPSILALILDYVRLGEVRGTFLESHFRWQIRTFWFALLIGLAVLALSLPLMLIVVGFATLWVGRAIIGLWLIYRIARGWMALGERRPMYT